MNRILAWLGYVPRSLLDTVQQQRNAADDQVFTLTNNLHSLYWHLGVPWKGFPPVRWRKLNEPPDEMMAAALARIDALKGAAK